MAVTVRNHSAELVFSLAVALGLDPKALLIRSIAIESDCKEYPIAIVEMVLRREQADKIVRVLERYKLVPIDDESTKEPR